MPETETLEIEVLRTRYEISADDERQIWMMERLWAPFIPSERTRGATPLHFEGWGEGATFQLADQDPIRAPAPWYSAIASRNELVLHAIDRAEGVVDIHSAVLERNGTGILLVGPYGVGKTTSALELMNRGFKLLSDDMAPVELDSKRILPFPKPLAIKTVPWEELEHLWAPVPEWLPPPEGLFVIPAPSLPLSDGVDNVGAVIFLKWEPETEIRLEELSAAAAVARCAQNMRALAPAALSVVTHFCREAVTVELTHSGAAHAVPELLRYLEKMRVIESPSDNTM